APGRMIPQAEGLPVKPFKAPGPSGPPQPLAVIRSYLSLAIEIGAPAYNFGDHRGCYEVYACTARMLLQAVEGVDDSKALLQQAVQRCATLTDPNQQAWTMRHAFDAILGKDSN